MKKMSLFTSLVGTALLVLLTGCIETGPPAPAKNFPAKFEKAPVAKLLPVGITMDLGDIYEDNADDTYGESKKVIVPTFQIKFVVNASVAASVSSTDTSTGANTKISVTLGVSESVLQEIVDSAYADFIAQLEASGFDVISPEIMRNSIGYKALEFANFSGKATAHYDRPLHDTRTYYVMDTSGLPSWPVGLSPFSVNNRGAGYLSVEHQATVITPVITVSFAELSGSGRGSAFFGGGTAKVSAKPSVKIIQYSTYNMFFSQNAVAKEMGSIMLDRDEVIAVEGDFATMKKTSGSKSGGFFSAVYSSAGYTVEVDPAKFKTLVLKGIQALNAGVVATAAEERK